MCSFNTWSMSGDLLFFSLLTAWVISSTVIGKFISSFIGLLWPPRSGNVSFISTPFTVLFKKVIQRGHFRFLFGISVQDTPVFFWVRIFQTSDSFSSLISKLTRIFR